MWSVGEVAKRADVRRAMEAAVHAQRGRRGAQLQDDRPDESRAVLGSRTRGQVHVGHVYERTGLSDGQLGGPTPLHRGSGQWVRARQAEPQ